MLFLRNDNIFVLDLPCLLTMLPAVMLYNSSRVVLHSAGSACYVGPQGAKAQQGAVGQEAAQWNQVKEHMSFSMLFGQLVTLSFYVSSGHRASL